jgi:hypothetical protein
VAGDWIKVEHTLPDKEEVDLIANRLKIDHDAVVGKLIRIWVWADQHTVNGNAVRVTEAFLNRLTNCPGFAESLLEVGWLARRNGRLSLPNFDRHNGQTAKSRALGGERVKRLRNGSSVTKALPEKRREEKNSGITHKGQSTEEYDAGSGLCAGSMIDLTEAVIRDATMFDQWIAAERSRSDGWVKSEDDEFFARAARSKAVADGTIRNIVGWFKDTISGKHYDRVKAKHENAVGRKRGPPVTCTTIPNFQAPDTEGIDE